jgi:hypothetical protein
MSEPEGELDKQGGREQIPHRAGMTDAIGESAGQRSNGAATDWCWS